MTANRAETAGTGAPENDEGSVLATPTPQGQTQIYAPIVPRAAAERKRLASIQAHAAMAGFELHQLVDGSLMVSRWQWCRALADLDAAERWLGSVGVRL